MKLSATAVLIAVIALMANGCATTGPTYSEIQSTMARKDPQIGRIFIYRPSAAGAAVQPAVCIHDEAVGKSVPYGFFSFEFLIPRRFEMGRLIHILPEFG